MSRPDQRTATPVGGSMRAPFPPVSGVTRGGGLRDHAGASGIVPIHGLRRSTGRDASEQTAEGRRSGRRLCGADRSELAEAGPRESRPRNRSRSPRVAAGPDWIPAFGLESTATGGSKGDETSSNRSRRRRSPFTPHPHSIQHANAQSTQRIRSTYDASLTVTNSPG